MGFAWIVLLAFLRLSTKVGLFPRPLSSDAASDQLAAWLAQPATVVMEPTARHPALLSELLAAVGTGGNLVNDAHLAALAIEHQAQIVSFDNDFLRFPGITLETPPSTATRDRRGPRSVTRGLSEGGSRICAKSHETSRPTATARDQP